MTSRSHAYMKGWLSLRVRKGARYCPDDGDCYSLVLCKLMYSYKRQESAEEIMYRQAVVYGINKTSKSIE